MRRARRRTLSHWFVFIVAVSLAWLITPPAYSSSRPQQSSSSGSSSSASSSGSSSTSTSKKKTRKRHARREPTQKAPTPERISEIQSALARGGYYQGSPNGKWDANTIAALTKFQSDNGIEPNGKINAASLQKLGLGSSTAGVSAPKTPTPPAPAAAAPASPPPPAAASPASTPAPPPATPPPAPSSTSSSAAAQTSASNTPSSASRPPQR